MGAKSGARFTQGLLHNQKMTNWTRCQCDTKAPEYLAGAFLLTQGQQETIPFSPYPPLK